jgi:hypothetical protein
LQLTARLRSIEELCEYLLQLLQMGRIPGRQPRQSGGSGEEEIKLQAEATPLIQQLLVGGSHLCEAALAAAISGIIRLAVSEEEGGGNQAGHGLSASMRPLKKRWPAQATEQCE